MLHKLEPWRTPEFTISREYDLDIYTLVVLDMKEIFAQRPHECTKEMSIEYQSMNRRLFMNMTRKIAIMGGKRFECRGHLSGTGGSGIGSMGIENGLHLIYHTINNPKYGMYKSDYLLSKEPADQHDEVYTFLQTHPTQFTSFK